MAGGVLRRRSGESLLLSHGFAVPAPPEGKPRAFRTVPAPRIYEGGGPRSGRGSSPPQRGRPSQSRFACQLSQRESQGSCAPFLPPAFMRGNRFGMIPYRAIRNGLRFRFLFAGRGLTGAVYSPPEMQVSVASGRGKWGQKGALWDVHNPAPENFAMFYREKCIFRHRDRFLHLICFAI